LLTDENEPSDINDEAIVGATLTEDTTVLTELEDEELIKKIVRRRRSRKKKTGRIAKTKI